MEQQFSESYPDLIFSDLILQREDLRTNDGCIHFMHRNLHFNGKDIYSWNYIKKRWQQHPKKYQENLLNKIFEK